MRKKTCRNTSAGRHRPPHRIHVHFLFLSGDGASHKPGLLQRYSNHRVEGSGLSEQVRILSCYEASGDFAAIMQDHPAIDESNIRHVIRQYRCHWRQRRLAIGLTLSMTCHFIIQCFSGFDRQFMQIKQTPNVFFLKPT